jgi:Tol biopolymer transport system component
MVTRRTTRDVWFPKGWAAQPLRPASGRNIAAERLLPSESAQWTGSWLRDGDTITFIQNIQKGHAADILGMRLSDRKPWGVIERPANQWGARVSRDGRWLAYMSNESGRFEIFVTRFPTAGRRWQVSAGGGELVWSRASDELYFRQGTRMMSVALDPAADPPVSQAVLRFDRAYHFEPMIPGLPNYDVAADGRFLMLSSGTPNPAAELELGLGWVQHLSARLAQRR